MKRLCVVIVMSCLTPSVFTQVSRLQVGDRLPISVVTQILNYPGNSLRLPLTNGKWLMLDFWTTGCTACIRAFPKIKQLQDEFGDRVQWILVNSQSKEEILHFLKKRRQLTGLDMLIPSIYRDSVLTGYFKPDGFPHCVWIDSSGVVRSITSDREVTEANIRDILNNTGMPMEQKDDSTVMYSNTPLYDKGKYSDSSMLIWSTTFSKYLRFFPFESGFSITENRSCISAYNSSVKRLYQIAFNDDKGLGNFYQLAESRTELQTKDTAKYVYIVDGKFKYENLYSYQAILPKMSVPDMKNVMQNDLKKYFNFDARMEKKYRLCWVLSTRDTLAFKTSGGNQNMLWDGVNFEEIVNNTPFDEFRIYLEHIFLQFSPFPLINDIKTDEHIDLILKNIKMYDPDSIKKALKNYGITLNLENRLIDVLVIAESAQANIN